MPNLFIIGAAKSGTTSLHHYLSGHPEISMSEPKEPKLFSYARWEERLPEYAEMLSPDAPVRGESSTRYTFYPSVQGIPGRIASKCPDARLIYVVRDPVDRVVAHYVEGYAQMLEHRTFASVLWDLDQPGNHYVSASRYAMQLEQWLEHFDRERILVVDQTDLRDRRSETILEVLEFLQVAPDVPAGTDAELNTSKAKERLTPAGARLWFTLAPITRRLPRRLALSLSESRLFPIEKVGKPALDEELRDALVTELSDEAERFRAITGKSFPTWSV